MNRKQRRADKSKTGSEKIHASPAVQGLFNEALRHHQAGRLAEAEQLYRQILTAEPDHADSLHLLGVLAATAGRHDIAVELIGRAINIQDKNFLYHNNLGNSFRDLNKLEEAVASYKKALALKPDLVEALNNMGLTLQSLGRLDEAKSCCQRAIALRPDYAPAHFNLGNIFKDRKKPDEAAACFVRVIALTPGDADAHVNLGEIRQVQGKFDEAQAHYKSALALKPNSFEALNNLGVLLVHLGQPAEASEFYERALAIKPDSVEILVNLADAMTNCGKSDAAIAFCERAIALYPDANEAFNSLGPAFKAFNNLGTAYMAQGKLDQAIACYKRVSDKAYSNLLLAMIYAANVSPQELAETAFAFGENIADPLRRQRPFIRDARPERKLRIGYVSPDFRAHAVNYFFEHLLRHHDREQFEVFGYSNNKFEDSVTARLKQEFDHWRDITSLSDNEAADLIESDAIDILIDLTGHTGKNRLLVFALKPAPVQVTWLGYPATTGMAAMDYRISDNYAEPPGMTEALNRETLWRLPDMFCCYQGHEKNPAVIDHPPFADNGYITFGCFNNFAKVTDSVLATWARILEQAPDSRLLLEIIGLDSPQFRSDTEARLQRLGLPLERVMLETRKRSNQFVLYNRIDIALDPFPCNGGTTSMDTVWMGVPFVTLAGEHFVSRMGVTILTNAGMPELIAKNREEYIDLAVKLALDKGRLRGLRHNLRQKVAASPIMNQAAFARNMEDAYREMWRKWCTR